MGNVRFTIHRKPAFAGALLPYRIYINGQFAGKIKNGGTISAEVPRAGAHYIVDYIAYFERNAVVRDSGLPEYNIELIRAGAWRKDSYNEFYICSGQNMSPLPSFHFEKFRSAIFGDRIFELSPDEQLLALVLKFSDGLSDDIDEILAFDHIPEMIDALNEIGAAQFAGLMRRIIDELFPDVELPLSDEQFDKMEDRIERAEKLIWGNKQAIEELHRGAKLITERLNSEENLY